MQSLAERIKAANTLLAPYAVLHEGILGRVHEEPDDESRFPFQRDRDRIIHSLAYRRLKGKTQVFVEVEGDHYRTRLTHTMEAAQISRDIARTLGLNEDLAECIALAHDLGHPPFGHAGEAALDVWMRQHGLSFEHNEQSHRIVSILEKHSKNFPGLNLNQEILDGLLKHSTPHDIPSKKDSHPRLTLEAQVVNIADEIAYTGHDCDDGLRANLFTLEMLEEIPLANEANNLRNSRGTSLRGAVIHLIVSDLYEETEKKLSSKKEVTSESISLSETMNQNLSQLREFLSKNMYFQKTVLARSNHGKQVITALCDHFFTHPNSKIEERKELSGSALPEAIKDYVSGMTDRFAIDQVKLLTLEVPTLDNESLEAQ